MHAPACHAHVQVDVVDARRMLRNEPPFQPLRLSTLSIFFGDEASII